MKRGDVIGERYKIIRGPDEDRSLHGGMGEVYLCEDQQSADHPFALKIFHRELLPDAATRERFLKEADIWMQLGTHPNIVRAYGVAYLGDGRQVYVVIDWVTPPE